MQNEIGEIYQRIFEHEVGTAMLRAQEVFRYAEACDVLGSPIERLFFASMMLETGRQYRRLTRVPFDEVKEDGQVACKLQATIGKYRVDFLLLGMVGGKKVSVVVECDGHEFHERTKEQAAKDRSRDRKLQSLGHIVLRFTGSELYRDPTKCVWEALSFLGEIS